MTERSTTALPHILREYKAEYNQAADCSKKSPREKTVDSKSESVKQSNCHENETKVTARDEGSNKNKTKRQNSPSQSMKSRESSTLSDYQYHQQQKKEEHFQKWQEFKTVNRDKEYSRLRKKVALQHELIHARDELFQQKIQEQELKQAEAKEAQRRKKHTKEAELVAKCRQSLELDKEKITNRRAHLHALHHKKEEKKEVADNSEIKGRISNRPLSVIQSRGGDSNRTSVTSSGLIDYSREDTFASYISEVDGMEGQPEELPQHKSELYRLFGTKQANYFLYPRIEPIKKKKIRVNPALRRQGGRAGASTLWSILRGQSRVKLVQADQRIPSELKDAYGAFVRECLTRHKTVAKRSFYSETEVPESEKIQDSSYHERVREMKNKMELMFRAAQLNEDKTSILLFNNPPPDFNDLEGQEGLMRYHPSWVPDEDEILEEDYKRWLKRKPIDWPTMEGEKDPQRLEVITPNDSCPTTAKCEVTDDESEDSDDWLINMIVNKPEEEVKEEKPKIKPPPKLVFLTEDMCKEEGKFWKKGKKNEIPEPLRHEESKPPPTQIKSMSAMAKRKANKTGLLEGNSSTIRRSNTAPPKADFAGSSDEKKTSWQPLTLNALTEYKPSFETSGQGSFRHGQDVLWKPILSTKS